MSWQAVQLSSVAVLDRRSIHPTEADADTLYVGLEHVDGGGAIEGSQTISSAELKSNKFIFTDQHVLFGKLRPYLRKIARPEFSGVCSTDIIPILPKDTLSRDYLFHLLRTPALVELATSRSSGANLPRLSPTQLAEFPIPLPPLPEQRRIAGILDAADVLRAKRREALAQLDMLLQSTFLDMFGDPVTNPMGWDDTHRLGDLADIVSGITKGRKANEASLRAVPYLAVSNVQDRSLRLDVVKTITATEAEIARYLLRPGDLLLTEGGDPDKLGRGTLWNGEIAACIHQNHVFRVRAQGSMVDPMFLNWIVGSRRGKSYFLRSAKQTTGIASINMKQLKAFPLLVPPLDLQRRFAAMVESVEQQKARMRAHLAELDALFASLQSHAFSGTL